MSGLGGVHPGRIAGVPQSVAEAPGSGEARLGAASPLHSKIMITSARIGEFQIIREESSKAGQRRAHGVYGNHRLFAKQTTPQELVREVLCNLLAQAAGIPVPKCFVIKPSGGAADDQFWFATEVAGRNYARAARSNLVQTTDFTNWRFFLQTVAFDSWIANDDRTPQNLLFLGLNEYALIDHGEALPEAMEASDSFRNNLVQHMIAANPDVARRTLAKQVTDSARRFADIKFSEIQMAGMPRGWRGNPEFARYCILLTDRLNHLPQLIETEFGTAQGNLILEFNHDRR